MARHRAVSERPRWRWSPNRPVIAAQRRAGIELVDARSGLAHQVSAEQLRAGQSSGDYQALCGARLLAASLTDPGRGRCPGCASGVTR
jgi:hypothetical protein